MKEYNKFFSYNNMNRTERNFAYKDFSYSDSYNTKFTRSTFYGNSFYNATIKYCGFNGCTFNFIEFDNVNFRGSRFIGAKFENVIFRNCNLAHTLFTDAIFINVYFENTGIQKIPSLLTNSSRQCDEKQKFTISEKLFSILNKCKDNPCILNSKTIYYRKKGHWTKTMKNYANTLSKVERKKFQREQQAQDKSVEYRLKATTVQLLLNCFSEEEIINGLQAAIEEINKPFTSFSYLVRYINKYKIVK